MPTSRISRRSLFGLGLGRLVEERLSTLDSTGAVLEAPPESDSDGPARRKDAARRAWGEGDPRPLFARLELAAAHLLEVCRIEPGQRLLDVGAGDGNLALAAARAGAEAAAVDLSPVLVERGRECARAEGVEVEWTVADLEALPYADASFDCAASNFGVIYADEPHRAIAELERVVRPGGVVAITAWSSSGLMGRVLRLAAKWEGPARPRARPERWGRFETAYLHFSGFDDFEVLEATLRMEFDTTEEVWAVFSTPPGPLAGALRAGADVGDLREELFSLVAGEPRVSAAGVALDVAYSVALGRRQTAPPLTSHATIAPPKERDIDANAHAPANDIGRPDDIAGGPCRT